jgi:hypothetical protein
MPTSRKANPALTLIGTSLRGVRIGIGAPLDVPVLSQDGGTKAPVKCTPKILIWHADKDFWIYAFLKKGKPKAGTTVGLAQRGRIVFYKVLKADKSLVKFKLDKHQVFGNGTKTEDYAKYLSIDASLFSTSEPSWFSCLALDTDKAKSKVLDHDQLRELFNSAKQLAQRAYTSYRSQNPDATEMELLNSYSSILKSQSEFQGKSNTYKSLLDWLDDYEGDPRTIAGLRRHIERDNDSLQISLQQEDKKLEAIKIKMQERYPQLKTAYMRLVSLGGGLCR